METRSFSPGAALLEVRSAFRRAGAFGELIPSEQLIDGLASAIEPLTTPGFTCTMNGGAMTTRYTGVEGLREGWRDFLSAFETLEIVPGEIRDSADRTAAIEFVRLRGKPRGASGEIEHEGAAVWRLGENGLAAVDFHLDRDEALRAGGLDPEDPGRPLEIGGA